MGVFTQTPLTELANIWLEEQTFGGGINIPLGQEIAFGDGDTRIFELIDDRIRVNVGGNTVFDIVFNFVNFTQGFNLSNRFQTTPRTFTDLDTTPRIDIGAYWKEDYSAPTTITDFDGGTNGAIFFIVFLSGNVTIAHGGNIHLLAGANHLFPADTAAAFIHDNTTGDWYQIGGDH